MIEAVIAGESDPAKLAALWLTGALKASSAELQAALRGRITSHHRFRLQIHLQQIDALSAAIAQIDQEADGKLEPFRAAAPLLSSIPGVGELSAQTIIAEIGADMRRFPTHAHLISWAELAKVPLA